MTLIYEYLEREYDYEFTIVTAETDSYQDDTLDVVSVPRQAWSPVVPHLPVFPRRLAYRRHLDPLLQSADGLLTVDPTVYPQGILGIRRADKHDVPVWFDTSLTVSQTGPVWYAQRALIRRELDAVSGIIATVPKCLERFRDIGLFDERIAEKFTVMGHPVDTERFAPTGDERLERDKLRILVVSRLVPEKGLYYILSAVAPILRSRSDVELAILGTGPLKASLQTHIRNERLDTQVEIMSPVPHADVPSVLNTADVFVNHAVSIGRWEEFFGVANLEAMACGLPCVVSTCGGIPFVIQESDVASIVRERDIVALRAAVRELLDSPQRRREMASQARAYVTTNYSVPRIGDRYHRMIQAGLE